MSTAVLLRVSSEEQRERQTIATQREFIARWCAKEQIVPVEWYADDGVSGTIPLDQRPAGAKLLRVARDGKFRTLEEVGREFSITRERIRQIEAKALRKLRHPSYSRTLRGYLD